MLLDGEWEALDLLLVCWFLVVLIYKFSFLYMCFNLMLCLNNFQYWFFGFFGLYFNQERIVIVQFMQCFEDVNEIDAVFVKWYVVELFGILFGDWLGVFQVDCGDMVNVQFQFGGNIIVLGVEVVDVWVDGELW